MGPVREKPCPPVLALLAAWLTIDLFGKARRSGERGSGTLTTAIFTQGFLSYVFAALAFEEVAPAAFLAGTLAVVAGFTSLALLGDVLPDQIGHPADRAFVLATPLPRVKFLLARALHVGLFLTAFGTGLAIAPAILGAFKTGQPALVPLYLAAALILSATITGLIQVPVLLAGRLAGRQAAASLSAVLRAVLFGGGFLAVLLGFRAMQQGPQVFPGGAPVLRSLPPYWYARLLLPGGEDWLVVALCLPILVGAALAGVAVLPERRGERRRGSRRARWLQRLLQPVARSRAAAGLAVFTVLMLTRDRSFRLRALPLLGLPAAAVVLGLRATIPADELAFFLALVHNLPLAYLPIVLFFVPHSEGWHAAWLVEASVGNATALSRRAVTVAGAALMVPVQGMLFLLDLSQRGAVAALPTTAAALGLAWLLLPRLAGQLPRPAFSLDPDDLRAPAELAPPLILAIVVSLGAVWVEALAPALRTLTAGVLLAAGGLALWGSGRNTP